MAQRRLRHWQDALGMVCFEGALPPETGIPLVTRIERDAASRHRAARRAGTRLRFEAHAADALVALVTEREEDPKAGPSGRRRGHGPDLVIVCDLYAWRRGHTHGKAPCHLLGGGPIPVRLAKELAADDAFMKAV